MHDNDGDDRFHPVSGGVVVMRKGCNLNAKNDGIYSFIIDHTVDGVP